MEYNYLIELAVIVAGLVAIYRSRASTGDGFKFTLKYVVAIAVFAAFHYQFTAYILNGSPIHTEMLFNAWILQWALINREICLWM